ncbi:hypothetical protein BGZ60DRAFT_535055 [Tricladium varicosporioides]|nr:hypothetical protein BGZ60DRAFT_535055 [Hymenoscyphus varicosporioides]
MNTRLRGSDLYHPMPVARLAQSCFLFFCLLLLLALKVLTKSTESKMFVRLFVAVAVSQIAIAKPADIATHPFDAVITNGPSPRLEIRADPLTYGDSRFLGWQVDGGVIYQRTCNTGYTVSTQSSYYACCATSLATCSFVTACNGLYTELFSGTAKSGCANYCITGRMYQSTNDANPLTYLGCGSSNYFVLQSTDSAGLLNWSPGIATATATPSTVFVTPTPSTSSTISISPTTTRTITGAASATQTSAVPTAHSSNNGAIIGGAVGGGLIAIGLIVLGILLYLRRSKKDKPTPQPPMQQSQPYQAPPQNNAYQNPNQPHDMRPMSFVPPTSPPPPWDGTYNGQQPGAAGFFAPGQKPGGQYQYQEVPKQDIAGGNQSAYWQQNTHGAAEMQGMPAPHAVEIHGTPIQQPPAR